MTSDFTKEVIQMASGTIWQQYTKIEMIQR